MVTVWWLPVYRTRHAGQVKARSPGRTQRGTKGFIVPKFPKLDLITDTECVAHLANVNMSLQTCNSAVYYTGMLYDIFLMDIIGYDCLAFG